MTPQEIQTASDCYECIPDKDSAILFLLDEIRILHGGESLNTQEIVEGAKCYACIPDKLSAQTFLLSEILDAQT